MRRNGLRDDSPGFAEILKLFREEERCRVRVKSCCFFAGGKERRRFSMEVSIDKLEPASGNPNLAVIADPEHYEF